MMSRRRKDTGLVQLDSLQAELVAKKCTTDFRPMDTVLGGNAFHGCRGAPCRAQWCPLLLFGRHIRHSGSQVAGWATPMGS